MAGKIGCSKSPSDASLSTQEHCSEKNEKGLTQENLSYDTARSPRLPLPRKTSSQSLDLTDLTQEEPGDTELQNKMLMELHKRFSYGKTGLQQSTPKDEKNIESPRSRTMESSQTPSPESDRKKPTPQDEKSNKHSSMIMELHKKFSAEETSLQKSIPEDEKNIEAAIKMVLQESSEIASDWKNLEDTIDKIKEELQNLKNPKEDPDNIKKEKKQAKSILRRILSALKKIKKRKTLIDSSQNLNLSHINSEEKTRIISTLVDIITLRNKAKEWGKNDLVVSILSDTEDDLMVKESMVKESIEETKALFEGLDDLVSFFSTILIKEEVIKNWTPSEISPLTQYFEKNYTIQDQTNEELKNLHSIRALESLEKAISEEKATGEKKETPLSDEFWKKAADSIGEGHAKNQIQAYFSDFLEKNRGVTHFFGIEKEFLPELVLQSKMPDSCFQILRSEMNREKQEWNIDKEPLKEIKNEYLLSILEKNKKIVSNKTSTSELETVRFLNAIIESISQKSGGAEGPSFVEVTPKIVSKIRAFNCLKNEKFLQYGPIINSLSDDLSSLHFDYSNCSEELLFDFLEQISLLPVDEEIKNDIGSILNEKRTQCIKDGQKGIDSLLDYYEDSKNRKEDFGKSTILLLTALETIECLKKNLPPQDKEDFHKNIYESLTNDKKQLLKDLLSSNEKVHVKNSLQKIVKKIKERETEVRRQQIAKEEPLAEKETFYLYMKEPESILNTYSHLEDVVLGKKYFTKAKNLLLKRRGEHGHSETMEEKVLQHMDIKYNKKYDIYYKKTGFLTTTELGKIKNEISSITSREERSELQTKGGNTYIIPAVTVKDINRRNFSYKDNTEEIAFSPQKEGMEGVQEWAEKLEKLKIPPQVIQSILCFSNQDIGAIPSSFYVNIKNYMTLKGQDYAPSASDSKLIIEPSSDHSPCRMKFASKVKMADANATNNAVFFSTANLSCILNTDGTWDVESYSFDLGDAFVNYCL